MHLRCKVKLTPLMVRYSCFTQALIPLQLVRQSANPGRPQQRTAPPAARPAHLSGRAPHTFPGRGPHIYLGLIRAPFGPRASDPSRLDCAGAYTLFRAEARAPFQARPGGACAPYRAGLVRPAGRGSCALPGGACASCRAGLVRPVGRRLCALPGWAARARTPFRSRASAPFWVSSLTLPDGVDPAPCA